MSDREKYGVFAGHLVEHTDECTCAGGGEWPHEEHCGMVPVAAIDDVLRALRGFDSAPSVAAAARLVEYWLSVPPAQRDKAVAAAGGGLRHLFAALDWVLNYAPAEPVPADAPVDIPLPPEPPRTRVIEALDADGEVVRAWEHDGYSWLCPGRLEYSPWPEVVWVAYADRLTLRHRAAESGGEGNE